MSQKRNRFSCLKSTEDGGDRDNQPKRTNRFQGPPKVINSRWQRSKSPERSKSPGKRYSNINNNSRWQRSKSPEKSSEKSPERNSFQRKKREDDKGFRNNNNRRYNKGGFGKYRYNHGRGGPSVFDGVKKDINGRPMVQGATTAGFDIGLALQQSNQKNKKEKKKEPKKEKPKLITFKNKKVPQKTEEEKRKEAEWNKQMILNMQYETESEEEEELENDD